MKKLVPTLIALGQDRFSIVLTDTAYGDSKHGTDCGGDNSRGYTADELLSFLRRDIV
jgi:hypothetical protein